MLDIRNLNKKYRNGFQLKDISLHLNPGDFTVLFGSDDAGKTALIYHVLGLHHFKEGEILFQGRSLLRLTEAERKELRFVPDSICMEQMTAKEYFKTIAKTYKGYDAEDAKDMCEYFGVNIDSKLSEMTYEENKLAMIIAAMVTGPKLLILDEPTNFLTRESTVKLLGFLKFLSSRGMTILISCESADEVQDYCSHYLYLQDGIITHQGMVADIYDTQMAVTIKGGSLSMAKSLLGAPVAKAGESFTFLYNKKEQARSLSEIVGLIASTDVKIESLTLEEILNKDYTRWI